MFNPEFTSIRYDGYDVKPYIHVNTIQAQIGIGRIYYASYLLRRDCIQRAAKVQAGAGLDLNKDYGALITHHQVKFLMTAPPVAIQYGIAVSLKIAGGHILAFLPQNQVFCHV